MAPLLARAEASSHHDVELMPLLDALIHLTMAIGGNVEPYAVRLMATAAAVAATHLSPPPAAGPPTNDAITTFALDAATALVEVLAGSTAALLDAVGPPCVLDAAVAACSHDDAAVAQSGFALAGELAACAPRALAGRGPRLLDACNARLARGAAADGDAAAVNALNNAAWAVGLLVAGLPGGEGAPHAVPAAERLAALLKAQGSAADADMRRVRENAAISLGRVAAVAPEALAPAAPHFLGEWCRTLAALRVRRPALVLLCAHTHPLRGARALPTTRRGSLQHTYLCLSAWHARAAPAHVREGCVLPIACYMTCAGAGGRGEGGGRARRHCAPHPQPRRRLPRLHLALHMPRQLARAAGGAGGGGGGAGARAARPPGARGALGRGACTCGD